MRIAIINGPNLNLVGRREPDIYGHESLDAYLERLTQAYADVDFTLYQSNHEGDLIDELQRVGFDADGIVLNAGAYTHTSIAIADAIRAITAPVVEVHISDVMSREPYRRVSMIRDACATMIAGYGLDSYRRAVDWLLALPAKS
ncbi:MAG: 3-dehydroquinate dehydratase [Muribaculaceae bacterium]|nr:3-dehydroquinate dehydratase [Muribaculaceae bacterium]